MSDPFKDLFDPEGLAVNPLAPSEVRRRGDRLRRRRNVAGVVAAAAAVALVATPIALFAGDDSSSPSPAPPGVDWVTTIPADFPILVGVENDPEGGSSPSASADDPGLGPVALCAQEVWPPDSVDRFAGTDPALDYHFTRELLLFTSDTDATAALARIRDGLAACDSEVTTDGAIPDTEFELLHTAYTEDTGADETVTWTDAYADGSIGTQVFQFVRVGNAIAGTEVSSESNKDGVAGQLPLVTGGSAQLADAMCIFAANPCDEPTQTDVPQPVNGDDIPEDFPLTLEQEAMEGDGGEFIGPSFGAPALRDLKICGSPVWTEPAVDRLASTATGPEYEDSRELRAYASADDAVAQMTAIRALLDGCREEALEEDFVRLYHQFDADTGYDTITYGTTYNLGTGEALFQVVRVGRAILARAGYGEWVVETMGDYVRPTTRLTERILPAMCVFTEAGCGNTTHGLTAENLPTNDDVSWHEAADWRLVSTTIGEGTTPFNPCNLRTLDSLQARAVVRRDFVLASDRGDLEGSYLTAVVAEFDGQDQALDTYQLLAGWVEGCEPHIRDTLGADRYGVSGPVPIDTGGAGGQAQVYLSTYGPVAGDEFGDGVYFVETGLAVVGNRVLIMTSRVAGQDYNFEVTPMQASLPRAVLRLV